MYYLLKGFTALITLIPIRVLYSLATFIVKAVFFFWAEKRGNIRKNYSIILEKKYGRPATAQELDSVIKSNYENYAKFNCEFLYINRLVKKGQVPPIENISRIQGALDAGKGLVIGTLHFSNWDIAGITIAGNFRGRTQVWAIADDLGGGYSRFVQESRNAYGINIVLPNKNLKDAYTCLKGNGILNVLVDRPVDPEKENAVEVEFFGKKTYVATAAARLALACGSQVMIGVARRDENGFTGIPGEVLRYEMTGDEQKDIKTVTQAMMKEAERIIMESPEQWYMFRDFWKSHAECRMRNAK